VFLLAVFCSCSKVREYDPAKQLTPQEKDQLMMKISRYIAKAPENINVTQRFLPQYDDHYRKKMSEARLEQFYKEGEDIFFLISQPAPSLKIKRHATGGKLQLDEKGDLKSYEEVFRTWKMTPDTLQVRSYFLFNKMVTGESLSPYYTENSNGIDFIEFPDDRTYFDKGSGSWRIKDQ
jgi:hypothetical protein